MVILAEQGEQAAEKIGIQRRLPKRLRGPEPLARGQVQGRAHIGSGVDDGMGEERAIIGLK